MSDVSSSTSSTYTGMSGAGGGDLIRITGMASGLDVDGMVKKMMAAEQTKLDKVKQQQQLIQWRQEAYQDIIKDIKDMQSSFFNVSDPTNNLTSQNNYAAFDVNIPDASQGIISATVAAGAKAGNYSVSFGSDGYLAQAAGVISKDPITTGGNKAIASAKLSDIGISGTNTIDITYNNNDGSGNIKKTISFTGNNTLNDLVSSIRSVTGGNVTASYSELTGKITIQTAKTGATTSLSISGDKSVLSALKLGDGNSTAVDSSTAGYGITPSDAKVYITPPGGTSTPYTSSSNAFTVDGINYNLQSKADSSFTVTQDTQKVHDKIKNFLDKYNAIIDKIQTKLGEKKNYDYPPLTDSQKSSMSDSDISSWNDKAKQGILRNDDNLEALLTSLRQAFTTPLTDSSTGKNITSVYFGSNGPGAIGIDTSDDYSQGSKITIVDDSKLNNMIAQYGDQVMKLFTNVSSVDTSTTEGKNKNFNESGIFQRMNSILKDNVGMVGTTLNSAILTKYANYQDDYTITGTSGTNTLPDQIYYQQLMINKMTDSMKDKQEKYYQQFSQLETAMNQLNSQQAALSSMLGG